MMTTWQALSLVMAAGVGTYLLRYLPLRWYAKLHTAFQQPALRAALSALGPAAIIALLVVSLNGLIDFSTAQQSQADLLRIALALSAIWISHRYTKNTMVATFTGVAIYALYLWLQG